MTSMEQSTDDNVIDEDGIGAGPLDTLNKGRGLESFKGVRNPPIGYKHNKFFGNVRTLNAYILKDLVMKGHINITDDELIAELLTLKYTFDHYQRRILVSKEAMKEKYGVKSPNKADALIMAVSRIGAVRQKQDEQYRVYQPQYSREDNILSGAGIR